MQHYFINKEHKETDFFEFQDEILNYKFLIESQPLIAACAAASLAIGTRKGEQDT